MLGLILVNIYQVISGMQLCGVVQRLNDSLATDIIKIH